MKNLLCDFINKLIIRARVTLILSIAESVLAELESDEEGFLLAQEALDVAWKWQCTGDISGDILAEYVDSPSKKDLGVRELYYEDDQAMASAVIAITLAVGYTARYAYQVEGERNIPASILEIDDESILEILTFAEETNVFDINKLLKKSDFLMEKYSTNNISELGEPITKESLIGRC